MFVHSERLPDSDLKWALSHTNGLLQFWSQLDNIITWYSGCVPEQLDRDIRIYMIAESIENISSDTEDPITHTLLFLADQLTEGKALHNRYDYPRLHMIPEVHKLLCRHKKTALSAECAIVERCGVILQCRM